MVKSADDFCRKYHGTKVEAMARAEKYSAKRNVSYWLHTHNKGDLWRTRVHQCDGGWWWGGWDLPRRYGPNRTTICTQEKPPSFFGLQSMLMVEENHTSGSRSTQSDNLMLCIDADRPRGLGGWGGSAHNSCGWQQQNRRHKDSSESSSGPSTSRESQGSTGNWQLQAHTECWYSSKKGHRKS